jgi:hypothetical protein
MDTSPAFKEVLPESTNVHTSVEMLMTESFAADRLDSVLPASILRLGFAFADGARVLTDELRNVLLAYFSSSQRQHHFNRPGLRKLKLDAIQSEGDGGANKGRALVAIAERMVLCDSMRVNGRQSRDIWLLVMEKVRGTGKRPLERVLIADAR